MSARLASVLGSGRATVRWRTTLAATGVVAVILAGAGIGLVLLQRAQMETTLRDLANQQTLDVRAELDQTGISQTDLSGSGSTGLTLVQILDRGTGEVLASSSSIAGEAAVVDARPAPGDVVSEVSSSLPISDGEPYTVVSRGVRTGGTELVVIAAQDLEPVKQASTVTIGLLLIGYLPLLAIVAAVSYRLTGRALAPVYSIRRRLESIGGSDLDERVPVPLANDEISSLAETMNRMLDRLEQAALTQRQFVADASHELRSPLASIRAAHDVARTHHAALSVDELHAVVGPELDRLERLVADLLTLASSDAKGLTPAQAPVALDSLLKSEVDQLHRPGIEVRLRAEPVAVRGDAHLLARAIRNLTDNAARHARSRVDISLERDGADAVVHVLDDGIGVPPDDRERIFERFVRLDSSRDRAEGGTGLGLPIAREVVRAHGGEVTIAPSDRGTHFVVRLPCVP